MLTKPHRDFVPLHLFDEVTDPCVPFGIRYAPGGRLSLCKNDRTLNDGCEPVEVSPFECDIGLLLIDRKRTSKSKRELRQPMKRQRYDPEFAAKVGLARSDLTREGRLTTRGE
jgi:hypothetical protein